MFSVFCVFTRTTVPGRLVYGTFSKVISQLGTLNSTSSAGMNHPKIPALYRTLALLGIKLPYTVTIGFQLY